MSETGIRSKRRLEPPDEPPLQAPDDGTQKNAEYAEQREEGEGSSEEEEESSDSDDDFGGLARGPEDRRFLRRMPELEREMELERRAAALQAEKDRKLLLRHGAVNDRAQKKKDVRRQRAAPARDAALEDDDFDLDGDDDDDDGQDVRRSARQQQGQSVAKKKLDVLEQMRAVREQRDQKAVAVEEAAEEGPGQAAAPRPTDAVAREDRVARLEDDSEEEELNFVDQQPVASAGSSDNEAIEEGIEDAGYEAIKSMQVLRSDLIDWIRHPNLEETLLDAVVRVKARHDDRYDMCLIHDVVMGQPYTLRTDTTETQVNKYLVILDPVDQKEMHLKVSLASNSPVESEEYAAFHSEREKHGLPHITSYQAERVRSQLEAARSYVLTEQDIARIVREKKEKGTLKKSIAAQKAEFLKLRQAAEDEGNMEAIEQANEALAQLQQKLQSRQYGTRGDMTGDLDALNRKSAAENRRRLAAAGKRERAAAAADGKLDPYSRKRTKVVQYWAVSAKGTDAVAAVTKADESKKKHLSPLEHIRELELPVLRRDKRPCLLARQLLGPQYRFRRTTVPKYETRAVITLAEHHAQAGNDRLAAMGLG